MKMYAEHFERVFQFAEYGDFEDFFIKLGYVVPEAEYAPNLGEPLTNKIARNGNRIFKGENIDFSKYKLLSSTPQTVGAGLFSVEELYGYAPSKTFTTYSAEPVLRFGLEDPSGKLEKTVRMRGDDGLYANLWDSVTQTFSILLDSAEGLSVGDLVHCLLEPASSRWYVGRAPAVPIQEISGNRIKVPEFSITFESNGQVTGTIPPQDVINVLNGRNSQYWSGTRKMIRDAATREPATFITNVANEISFFETFPALDGRFVVSNGTAETNTITTSTSPTVDAWKAMIATQTLYVIQDATVDVVFPKTFYKKTVKKATAR